MHGAAGDEPSDHAIAELIFDGNEQGLYWLLDRYGARVHFLLLQHFSPLLTEDDVKEVLSFAGMKAFRAAHTFDAKKGNLGGWFYAIARNMVINFIREGGQLDRVALPLEYDPAVDGRVPAGLEDEPRKCRRRHSCPQSQSGCCQWGSKPFA